MARSGASSKLRLLHVPLLCGSCHNSKTAGRPLPALPPPHPVPAPPPPPPQPVPAPAEAKLAYSCLCLCGVVVAETMTLKGHLINALRWLGGCFTTTDCSAPHVSCCGNVAHHHDDHSVVHHHSHYYYPHPALGPRLIHEGLAGSAAPSVPNVVVAGSSGGHLSLSGSGVGPLSSNNSRVGRLSSSGGSGVSSQHSTSTNLM